MGQGIKTFHTTSCNEQLSSGGHFLPIITHREQMDCGEDYSHYITPELFTLLL